MYDYYLGGKDDFEADRVAAEQVLLRCRGALRRAASPAYRAAHEPNRWALSTSSAST